MDWQAWFTVGIVALVFYGLIRELAPPDVLMVGGALLVGLAGIITPHELFRGLTNEGMLTVAALFIVAAGMRETGVLDIIGSRILGKVKKERGALLRLFPPVVGMSAFLNNTPIVAMLMPVVTDWCRKHRISPSRLLMPLSYLAILGGTCTLIGTSTNLIVNGMMIDRDMHPMRLFELGYVGLPYAIVGIVYLLYVGRRLLPDRKDLLEQLGESSREYLVDMLIQPECRLIGQQVEEAGLRHLPGLFLIEITRDNQIIAPVRPDEILQVGDRLTFTGVVSTIVDLERIPGLIPAVDESYETHAAQRRGRQLCEAVISPTSPLIGKNIREANFRALYNAAVVAVHRGGERLKGRIGDIVLRSGDTLLLQTTVNFNRAHRNNPDFYLVSSVEESRPVRHDRATLSAIFLVLLIVLMTLSTSDILPWPLVLVAFLTAGLMVATRCISASAARQSVNWQVLLTIVAALALGKALEKTGAAESIANMIAAPTETLGPTAALAVIYLIAQISSSVVGNNAAAVLVFPIAISIAAGFQVDPRPFAMAVAFAASASFASPIAYQTNLMVYGPGGYQFMDFLKMGLPLNLILCAVATILIPMIWPF
ncbi:MAG: SLC13 family permease [Planctomycetota bacterium]|nr:MAG: SLC13 family permease [Planctomycetota bacterium]